MIDTPIPVEHSNGPKVLVSGAGFAGLAMAFWLHRLGYDVTVIEVGARLRRGGTPVDIEGETIQILKRMGMLGAVRAKALPPRKLIFKNVDDMTVGEFGGGADPAGAGDARYEIHRDDLLEILFAAVEGAVEVMFGRSIQRLDNGPDKVTATFTDGEQSDYALVFGCDGNRSNTRRLVFEEDAEASYFMGGYFFIKVAPTTGLLPANMSEIFSVPGRTALLNGYDDQTDIAFAFRTEREIDYDHRDRAGQRRMVHDHFEGLGWKTPTMLDQMDADDDFYFDKLNQIRMATWSKGRVVLVGDAGYCVSPVAGMGGSMAIIGAARLADELRRHGADYVAAFQTYHADLKAFVEEVQQKAAGIGMSMMFPADDAEVAERDRKLKTGELAL